MKPVLPSWCRNAIAILLVFIFCEISLSWQSHVKVSERLGDYLGVYKILEFKGAERHTYNDNRIHKVWYVVKGDEYEEDIAFVRFLRPPGLRGISLTDIKKIAYLRKKVFHNLAKEMPELFDPIDRCVVYPKKEFNCRGYMTEQQTHHGRKIISEKIFEFVQGREAYGLQTNVTFKDKSIQDNPKLQKKIHDTWKKVVNGLRNSCSV